MTLAEISDIAQAVAAAAVIASLGYLAIQTRQAARNAKNGHARKPRGYSPPAYRSHDR